MTADGWPPALDPRDRRPARAGCAPAIGLVGGHLHLYVVGVGAISAIVYVVGRLTR